MEMQHAQASMQNSRVSPGKQAQLMKPEYNKNTIQVDTALMLSLDSITTAG